MKAVPHFSLTLGEVGISSAEILVITPPPPVLSKLLTARQNISQQTLALFPSKSDILETRTGKRTRPKAALFVFCAAGGTMLSRRAHPGRARLSQPALSEVEGCRLRNKLRPALAAAVRAFSATFHARRVCIKNTVSAVPFPRRSGFTALTK